MSIIDGVVLSLLMIILFVCIIMSYLALSDLEKITNYAANVTLESARHYLMITIGLCIVAFLIIIALLVMTLALKYKIYSGTPKYISIGLAFFAWLLILIAGICMASASSKMRSQNANGKGWAVATAVFLLLFGNLMMLGYSVYTIIRRPTIFERLSPANIKEQTQKGIEQAKRLFGSDRRSKAVAASSGETTGLTDVLNRASADI